MIQLYQENRERRLRQKADHERQRRERERSQRANQLIVGGDGPQQQANTNQILQQMNQEIHADRLRHLINGPQNPAAIPNAVTLPRGMIVDSDGAENDSTAPPPPRPLPHPMTILTTPMNPLVLGPLNAGDPMDYNHRSAIRRNIDRARIDLMREERRRESVRLSQQRHRERERQDAEQQQQEQQPQEPLPKVNEILTCIGCGDAKAEDFVQLHEHPDIVNLTKRFHKKLTDCKNINFFHCPHCKERGPHTREHRRFRGECTVCVETRKKSPSGCRKYSKDNKMDPFPNGFPSHLPKLRPIEEALIARSHTVMKCYRIQGNGRVMYKGNVVNLQKETNLLNCLPAAFDELPICFVVRIDNPNAPTHRDFKCRREVVRQWLLYLKQNSPMYKDLPIRWDRVQDLPEDGNVSDRIQRIVVNPPRAPAPEVGGDQEEEEEQELEDGPDTSGATGAVDGGDNDDDQMFIPRPIREMNNGLEVDRIRNFVLNGEAPPGTTNNPINLPPSSVPINDYDTPHLQSMAFPSLFPCGEGDVTMRDRTTQVSMNEANKHLLWYCVKEGSEFVYPFAQHNKWMYWAQNTDERHRFNQLKRVYQARNPEYTGMEVAELHAMAIQQGEDELRRVTSGMMTYGGKILGSDSYFYKKRKELEALIQVEGSPTLWFTFSAADNHWVDLHSLGPQLGPGLTEKERVRKRAKWVRQNPHVVDAYFFDCIKFMIEEFFGSDGLETAWVWFCIEFQSRGTAHIHGCCRLKSDPGLMDLAQEVLKGREACLQLMASGELSAEEDPFSEEDLSRDKIERTFEPIQLTVDQKEKLKDYLQKGFKAQEIIREFNDYLISTWHPEPPGDALRDQRDQSTVFVQEDDNRHPCNAPIEDLSDPLYLQTINTVQRHQCGTYCLRDGKCSKNFPIPVGLKTLVSVVQSKLRNGNIHTKMELYSKRNDKFLNAHSRAFLMAFKANMDI